MATNYRNYKDSLDNIDEKGYSEHSDDDESPLNLNPNNNFMLQVQHQRRLSFSYSKQSENDSDDGALTPFNPQNDLKNPYLQSYDDTNKPFTPYNAAHALSNHVHTRDVTRKSTDGLMESKPIKLERRHSADKVLSKPSSKNTNSTDYLTRMVITLRSKITTYKEDLRIAGELGQKLFTESAKRQQEIEQFQNDFQILKRKNDELRAAKDQLLQHTQIDAEHTKQLETDLHLQMSTSLHKTSKYEQECVHLKEELQRTLDEIRQLRTLNDQQRIEIETLETRNEQIAVNAGETIDDLSQELAEEKDGHSILKHKHHKLRNECTKLKINYEKRGTEIQTLRKQLHERDMRLLKLNSSAFDSSSSLNSTEKTHKSASKQEMKLLYRQIDNYKDEMEGISKHLDLTKTYLKTMMNCLENSVLLEKDPDVNQIYTLCNNARQFLGIEQPPPTRNISDEAPELPQEHSAEAPPIPQVDDMNDIVPPIPREQTPPLKVSNIERIPLSVPALPQNKSASPPPIPCMPSDEYLNNMIPTPMESAPPKIKISHKAMEPQSHSAPRKPHAPQIPLPPPMSPPQQNKVKIYSKGLMPSPVKIHVDNAPNAAPSLPPSRAPSIPKEVNPKTKSFSSARAPPSPPSNINIVPSVPQMPSAPDIKSIPDAPEEKRMKPKVKVINKAMIPAAANKIEKREHIAPKIPSSRSSRTPAPHLPATKAAIPQAVIHNLGVMPVPIVDEKPLSVPSVPNHIRYTNAPPLIPQETRQKVKVCASAMEPPPPTVAPNYAPPSVPTPVISNAPAAHTEFKPKMEGIKSRTQIHNMEAKKKKKKKKPKKKERDTIEDQKMHLTKFFSTYSDSKNWSEGEKENGVQKYILRFAEREPLNARMAFLYSMTLYLGQIVGVNKRCISHAFMLFKSVRAQIDTLCEEFALILQTLEHHNDDKLWKYVYSFLYNAAAYFKHIQRFVGTRTSVDNPRKYSRALKAGSRDYTNLTRRESSFRKLSGLSDISSDYNGNPYRYSSRRQIYGSANDKSIQNNDSNKMRKEIKVIRK